jgi:plasmid maintenance system antidote protein VapI
MICKKAGNFVANLRNGETMTQEEIRIKLKLYLDENPVTISRLANHIGIHYRTLSDFLKGRRRVYQRVWAILQDFIETK